MNIYPHVSRPQGLTFKKVLVFLAALVTLALCGYGVTSAKADDHRQNRGHDVRHDRNDYRGRRGPYFYAAPVYAPPVYVAPAPPSGVSLFFPLDIRFH